ncbi:DUF1659 domain-containing protein [Lederbergia graminis]|uniref:DUF1659 domain-containing protein n=1 Tax=Lederbergia graminis TaxID=735518 RepID=A0ABW0LFD7_9BACI|nr:DUF1659 domain-containing protein [Paenibacillus bovis]HLU23165.1 DUF1659 domain-containing protein [Bacillaceae bacterium]
MANAVLKASRLRLIFDYGFDEDNKPVYKSKTYNNIRQEADADQLYQAAQAIGSLKAEAIWEIERNDTLNIDE